MTDEQNRLPMTRTDNDELIVQRKESLTHTVEIRSCRSTTCYICLENIVATHKQFGLQNNCNHVFCFDCLLTWRRTETGGRCPLCRTSSPFIAPSWRCFHDADDKQLLIDAHKSRLKTIPCRTLSRYGYCRFGHRCYYSHHTSLISPFSFNRQNAMQSMNEHNNDEQQEPSRRITYNSYRYRPY